MQSIVINSCYGGFGLSHLAMIRYAEIKRIAPLYIYNSKRNDDERGYHYVEVHPEDDKTKMPLGLTYSTKPLDANGQIPKGAHFSVSHIKRDDPALVQVVRELGEKANDRFAELQVVEIPDGVRWEIDEYDGMETVDECHQSWS